MLKNKKKVNNTCQMRGIFFYFLKLLFKISIVFSLPDDPDDDNDGVLDEDEGDEDTDNDGIDDDGKIKAFNCLLNRLL